jgi:hypothetical protein
MQQSKKKTPCILSSSPNLLPNKYQANNCKSPMTANSKMITKGDSTRDIKDSIIGSVNLQNGFDSFG